MKATATAGCVAIVACVLATASLGARQPTSNERHHVVSALRLYVDSSDCCAVIKRIKVDSVRVSTVDRRWAFVGLEAWDQHGVDIGGAGAVLHMGFLTGAWSVRYFGSDGDFCGAPASVRRDLHLRCY